MNDLSNVGSTPRLMKSVLSLLLAFCGSEAVGNTYFKCVDAKGSVTVQQTACAVTSSQEERKVWAASKMPLSQPTPEPSSPTVRPTEVSGKPRPR